MSMHYIVLDLEWNYPVTSDAMITTPVRFPNEVIQIGAVKTDENLQPLDSFRRLVRPVFYRRMHRRVTRLTGLTDFDLMGGLPFATVAREFRDWCGEDFIFVTWSRADEATLRSNLTMHRMNDSWLPRFCDAQHAFGQQVAAAPQQCALLTALEVLGEEALPPHDALHDAMNTVRICQHLDIVRGLAEENMPLPAIARSALQASA